MRLREWFRLRKWRSKTGVGITEAVVAVGLLGTAVGVSTQFFNSSAKAKQVIKARRAMESIAQDVENKVRIPELLLLSTLDSVNNKRFTGCVIGADEGCTTDLQSYNPAAPNKFSLLYQKKVDKIGNLSGGPMLGDKESKLGYYDLSGRACESRMSKEDKSSDGSCIFKVSTFYYATCESNPKDASCRRGSACTCGAEHVHTAYTVEVDTDTTDWKRLQEERGWTKRMFPKLPRVLKFHSMPAEKILGPWVDSTCNYGASIRGYDIKGTAICKCSAPFVQSGSNRRGPLCAKEKKEKFFCKGETVFTGLNENGQAICKKQEEVLDCYSMYWYEAYHGLSCRPGYYMQNYSFGNCLFYCQVGGSGGDCTSSDAKKNISGVPSGSGSRTISYQDRKACSNINGKPSGVVTDFNSQWYEIKWCRNKDVQLNTEAVIQYGWSTDNTKRSGTDKSIGQIFDKPNCATEYLTAKRDARGWEREHDEYDYAAAATGNPLIYAGTREARSWEFGTETRAENCEYNDVRDGLGCWERLVTCCKPRGNQKGR